MIIFYLVAAFIALWLLSEIVRAAWCLYHPPKRGYARVKGR